MFPVLTLSSLDAVYPKKYISLFQGKTFCIINNGLELNLVKQRFNCIERTGPYRP